jgi:hypothetical protein
LVLHAAGFESGFHWFVSVRIRFLNHSSAQQSERRLPSISAPLACGSSRFSFDSHGARREAPARRLGKLTHAPGFRRPPEARRRPNVLLLNRDFSPPNLFAHGFSRHRWQARRSNPCLSRTTRRRCIARNFGSPGEPCHRFDLARVWFLVRLFGSINFHRSSRVCLGFVSVSRSVPADHVPSPLLCLGHCLVRSREECPCAAGWTCGRARSTTSFDRAALPSFSVLLVLLGLLSFNRSAECFISAGPISSWV